jgi:hypothetical protein
MIREARKHEDELNMARHTTEKLNEELARATSDRVINDTKLSELDHLVSQLLSVNESLLNQLSSRVVKKKKSSTSVKKEPTPRASSSASAKIEKLLRDDAGAVDTTKLVGIHQMYKSLANSIINGPGTKAKKKTTTRIAKKKRESEVKAENSTSSNSKSNHSREEKVSGAGSTKKRVNIRVPMTAQSIFDESFQHSVSAEDKSNDYKAEILSLEQEFDELNDQYRRLLSSTAQPSSSRQQAAVADSSDQLVDVIQQLHKKGERLRALKSPPNSK